MMTTAYEQNRLVLINLKVSRKWREVAHKQAKSYGMNLSQYLRELVEQDIAKGCPDE